MIDIISTISKRTTNIKRIKCSGCHKYLLLKKAIANGQSENTWNCQNPNCPNYHVFYPEHWFDVFKQQEENVER